MAKKIEPSDFVHLHNHTQYSLLDGLTRVSQLMDFTSGQGMKAVAMTDHGNMSGAIDFYKEAVNHEIKPLIGIETYVAARKHTDKDPSKDKNRYHLIILSMNEVGYKNLMRLSTIANIDGFYYYPRIDHDLLEQYNEGLIILSACMGGEIGNALKEGQYAQAKETALWYKRIFGDRYYLEVQDHGHPKNPMHSQQQQDINDQILRLSAEVNIPAVVTADAHYLRHEDQDAHEVLLCVGTGSYLSDPKRMTLKEFPLHVTEPAEIIARWGAKHPDLITNTGGIADRCKVEIKLGSYHIPQFPVPEKETEKSYLDKLTYQGLVRRYAPKTSAKEIEKLSITDLKKKLNANIIERAEYELGVVDRMGFNGYFLIVQDFINWGKNQGIVFGPGRGSGAGSIVAYALRITELDPLTYDLLFERFLNPDRISMPDFDVDIQDTRRDEVIQYCVERYGSNRVANIVTFGRMQARNAVRDVARVLQVPYADADRLAKMVPQPVQGRHIPLEKSLQENQELKAEYKSNETSRIVLDQAIRLEGTIRSHGVHAAGVVIAPDDIVKFVPLEMAQKGVITTQYPMGPIEELGLLKMDFLGLSNLTIIKNALRIIKRVHGKDIDIGTLPLDDKKTYQLFQAGDTTGVFQFESAGMKRYLRQLKPTVFDDLIAMNALYRPGPMQWIDDFIARKHGLKKIEYIHPAMEPALKTTYGVIAYQEQVMQISKEMCGFTGGQADSLRKGIGKKIPEVLAKFKSEFIEGAIKTVSADRTIMERFWKNLEAFASYAFPKAHSACYAMIAYQTAYLKANYPAEFMAALMTSDYDDIDRLAIEITECKHMGIEVLQPDINESFNEFAVVPGKNQIRFGLRAIKNVGSGAVEEILRARKSLGKFDGLESYFSSVNVRTVNKKALESLIKAGAFDHFADRSVLIHNMDVLLAYANKLQKDATSGQTDLFGSISGENTRPSLKLNESVTSFSQREQLVWERELLGLYLSQHPLASYETFLAEQTVPLHTVKPEHDGKSLSAGGNITDVREITTRNGQKMAFVKLADQFGEIELILFPNIYQQTLGIWERDRIILAKGKITSQDKDGNVTEEIKMLVDDAREVTAEQAAAYQATGKKTPMPKGGRQKKPKLTAAVTPQRVYIRLLSSANQDKLLSLKQTIDAHPGETEVVLVIGEAQRQIIRLPGRIAHDDGIESLRTIVGHEHVKLQ
ncbi:MAG TPA: DNA polymerase III subunit alpha [Candidatus Limnocylindrales bacterium]|nr:DNA polymerase III subunit alpha [Candidatus Limnocylindrales bacterium]